MSNASNEYVLATSLHHGWITAEQKQSIEAFLASNQALSALDVMVEQQLVHTEVAEWLKAAVALQSSGQPEETSSVEPASTPAESKPVVVMESGLHHVDDYLTLGFKAGCSDVHLGPDFPPTMRYQGKLVPLYADAPYMTSGLTEKLARGFLNEEQINRIGEVGACEFCYEVVNQARYRASIVRQRRGWEMVFRIVNSKVPTIDELGLPEVLKKLTRYHNGLILITGAVGNGKSTTMAAMIEHINRERHDHIITLEDPVEYDFNPVNCQISQREVHSHTHSFATALRASLREDPDVIMVGEMRDLETISLAITASETGHLVLGTLHTSTAARTLDRLLDVFPIDQQAQIRTMVSDSIRGIICQQLIPRADGRGRVLAMEIMLNNPAVGSLIRESKTFMLPGVIQVNRKAGMQLMDDNLLRLLDSNLITQEEAYNRSENKKMFAQELARRQSR